MSVMFCTRATSVKKKCPEATIVSFDTAGLHFLTFRILEPSQPAITLSKLTIETLEQKCEICSKLTIKPPKRRHWRRFGGLIANFEHILHLCSSVSNVKFEQVNASWDTHSEILSFISVTLSHINDVIVVPSN